VASAKLYWPFGVSRIAFHRAGETFTRLRFRAKSKIVNTSSQPVSKNISIESKKKPAAKAVVTTLQSNDPNAVNSIESPKYVSPQISETDVKSKQLNLILSPYSFTVVRVKMQ